MASFTNSLNNERISLLTYEMVDTLFEESMHLYLSESGMRDEHNADVVIEEFLDSYSFNQKILHLLKNNISI